MTNDYKIKICGMKYAENITEVAALLPDFLGFIFYEKSKRYFDGIIPKLPNSIKKVGVFVDEKIDTILDKISDRGYESLSKEEKEKLFNASKK